MEHRLDARHVVNTEVTIERQGRTTTTRASDVSVGGMRVETMGAGLAVNTTVMLDFELGSGRELQRFRLPAIVVHAGNGSAGLMFLDVSEQVEDALRAALRRQPIPIPVPAPIGAALPPLVVAREATG
jgi:c-di-GMP-binding flagellar brake protein YcgR